MSLLITFRQNQLLLVHMGGLENLANGFREIAVLRISNVNFISQSELYHLQLSLHHVKNATSFENMLTFDSITSVTYKQYILVRGDYLR